jgi:hypothetical protein
MKIGDSIKSIKPGNLNGFIGDILSIDTEHKRVTAISKDSGTWRFSFDEFVPLSKESSTEPLKKPIVDKLPFEVEKDSMDNLEFMPTKGKRPYHKKAKNEPIKEKRKYTKKS